MRKGVPLVADVVLANSDRGLTAISLTAYNPALKGFLEGLDVKHSVALMSVDTKECPYVDVGRNGFTYVFVVRRCGTISWRGNPAAKDKEFIKAVGDALAERAVPPLEISHGTELRKAAALYHEGKLMEAAGAAARISKKYSRKKGQAAEDLVRDAAGLMAAVDAVAQDCLDRMNDAAAKKQGIPFVEALDLMSAGFRRSDLLDKAREIERRSLDDESFAAELKAARAWFALIEKRPVLFPARKDRPFKSFAGKLGKFVKEYGGTAPAAEAKKLLDRFRS